MGQLRLFRIRLSWVAKVVTAAAAAGLAIAVPAYAAGARPAAPGSARPTTERQSPALRGPGLISPLHGMSPRTAARPATASSTRAPYPPPAPCPTHPYFPSH